jgi:hypothetical protein
MTASGSPVPRFASMRLQGNLATQYMIDTGASGDSDTQDQQPNDRLELDNLGAINIFVGANNSGKSRLMRGLFGNPYLVDSLRLTSTDGNGIECLRKIYELYTNAQESPTISALGLVSESIVAADKEENWISPLIAKSLDRVADAVGNMIIALNKELNRSPGKYAAKEERRTQEERALSGKIQALECWCRSYESAEEIRQRIKRIGEYRSLRRCYVPMLRGMRPPAPMGLERQQTEIHGDIYERRTVYDYFSSDPHWSGQQTTPDPNEQTDRSSVSQSSKAEDLQHEPGKPVIFTGLNLYKDLQRRLLAPSQRERMAIREYEQFLSRNFFSNREVTLTPALNNHKGTPNDVVHIKIGDDEDRPIHELGDGMQGLIICTYPIITEPSKGVLFFLEEPDIGMHPSLQRIFLQVLKDYCEKKGHQFFLTTHSNHLLDILQDNKMVSIFTFSEDDINRHPDATLDKEPTAVETPPKPRLRIRRTSDIDRYTLLSLGVRPSSAYLANATVWVEGISDCAYIRAYLQAFISYLKDRGGPWGDELATRLMKYKEDRHYAFIEYSGANLTHFSFEEDDSREQSEPSRAAKATTHTPSLCGNAIVVADGDIREKGTRVQEFARQLNDLFIILPGKEIENLIPEKIMKGQILADQQSRKASGICADFQQKVNRIKYSEYSRERKEGRLQGVGGYLRELGIDRYETQQEASGRGSLKSNVKMRWSSSIDGIPARVLHEASLTMASHEAGTKDIPNTDHANTSELGTMPSYLSQDAAWLCIRIYLHVSIANQDRSSTEMLSEISQWTEDRFQTTQPTESTGSFSANWPSFANESQHMCLLTEFLRRNQP